MKSLRSADMVFTALLHTPSWLNWLKGNSTENISTPLGHGKYSQNANISSLHLCFFSQGFWIMFFTNLIKALFRPHRVGMRFENNLWYWRYWQHCSYFWQLVWQESITNGMKGRNSPHFLGVNITTDNIESGSCERLMTFLELLFRGQNAASKQIFGLHIFWTKLQMQPMSFFTAALSHSENAQQILARRAIYVRQIFISAVQIKIFGWNFALQ